MQPARATWVMTVLIMMHVMMGGSQAACQDNIEASNFAEGARLLKNAVVACVGGTPFFMPTEGVNLLSGNIPNDFDKLNAQRRLVEAEYDVLQTTNSKHWVITIDADNATTGSRPQRAHYGYTIYGKPSASRVTGHIFFPNNVVPPYVRPELNPADPDPYDSVYFRDASASNRFSLTGVNRFLKRN